jgi:hypothetical protein
MQRSDSLAHLTAHARHVRTKRHLVNLFAPLLVIALALLVFHWVFPSLFSVLAWVWRADVFLLLALALLWGLGSWAFAAGKIKCPACVAPFAAKFHLWIPKTCQACGYDITAPRGEAISNDRRSGRP